MNLKCECGNDEAILEVPFHTDRVWLCLKCLDKYFPSGGAGDYAKNQGAVQKEEEGCEWGVASTDVEPNRPKTRSMPEMQSTL